VGVLDVPVRSPALIHRGELIAARHNGIATRALRRLTERFAR
jgi:hypothetical protein